MLCVLSVFFSLLRSLFASSFVNWIATACAGSMRDLALVAVCDLALVAVSSMLHAVSKSAFVIFMVCDLALVVVCELALVAVSCET